MFGIVGRMFGRGGAPRAIVGRFTPRLEVLDGRALPSGGLDMGLEGAASGGVTQDVSRESQLDAGAVFVGHVLRRGSTEEIPQLCSARAGEEMPALTRRAGEEMPAGTRRSGEEVPA